MCDAFLDRVLPLLGDNGVLGLGEPTHGTAEAFAGKFEVIHELARRGLLATLAVEESYTVGRRVDAALQGAGDLDAAWSQGSSIWRTATIRTGLRTLRQIIESQPPEHRTGFLGVDVSKPYRTARDLLDLGVESPLLGAMADRAVLSSAAVTALAALCRKLTADGDPAIAALAGNLARHVDAYLAAPDLARLHRRDQHMAATLLENLPERGITVLWAHNEHIARNPEGWGGPTMGHVLAEALGPRYLPIGVLCGEGTCRAVDPSTGGDDYAAVPLPPIHEGTTDAALTAQDRSLVLGEEFAHPGPRRFIGWKVDTSLFADDQAVRATFEIDRPSSDFAGLAFLPRSTADVTAP